MRLGQQRIAQPRHSVLIVILHQIGQPVLGGGIVLQEALNPLHHIAVIAFRVSGQSQYAFIELRLQNAQQHIEPRHYQYPAEENAGSPGPYPLAALWENFPFKPLYTKKKWIL